MENLRFRAWDKEDERMKEVFNIDFHRFTAIVGFRLSEPKSFLSDDPLIIMQSTGIKDKNGIDIFEGDILKIFVLGNQGAIAKVIFKNGMFGIEDDMHGYGYDKGLYSLHQILSLRDAEILGNKYEHPNLLED